MVALAFALLALAGTAEAVSLSKFRSEVMMMAPDPRKGACVSCTALFNVMGPGVYFKGRKGAIARQYTDFKTCFQAAKASGRTKILAECGGQSFDAKYKDLPCTTFNEDIGTSKDNCCSVPSVVNPGGNQHNACYKELCDSAVAGKDPCPAFCKKDGVHEACRDIICRTGRCDVKGAYSAVEVAKTGEGLEAGAGNVGAIMDVNPMCSSVMMTDDGRECGYQAGCTTVRLGKESVCGYWCGRELNEAVCNTDQKDGVKSAETNVNSVFLKKSDWDSKSGRAVFTKPKALGGCEWDDSRPGACRVDTTVDPRGGQTVTTITGCQDNKATACSVTTETATGKVVSGGPCKPCNLGFCQAEAGAKDYGREGAKCRAKIGSAHGTMGKPWSQYLKNDLGAAYTPWSKAEENRNFNNEKDVRMVVGTADELGFSGGAFPDACKLADTYIPATATSPAYMMYQTMITDFKVRGERCTQAMRNGIGCSWINQGDAKGCVSNMCGYLNGKDMCTIQNTDGRCIWFEKKNSYGIEAPGAKPKSSPVKGTNPYRPGSRGCFNTPCGTPSPNKAWKCAANGNNPGLAGCLESCAAAVDALVNPENRWNRNHPLRKKFGQMHAGSFYRTFPACQALAPVKTVTTKRKRRKPSRTYETTEFGCPCNTLQQMQKIKGPGNTRPYSWLTSANYKYGPSSGACKTYLEDPQSRSTYCEQVGPCINKLEANATASAAAGSNAERFLWVTNPAVTVGKRGKEGIPLRKGKKQILQINTEYECDWKQDGFGSGDNIGCQNRYKVSHADGNHVGCDRASTDCCVNGKSSWGCKLANKQDASRKARGLQCNPLCMECYRNPKKDMCKNTKFA